MVNLKNFNLNKKVVIITGGAGLLGSSFVEAIAEINGIPIILDINKNKAIKLCKDVSNKYKIDPYFVHTDITDKKSINRAKSLILQNFKKIDVLINNASNNPKINHKIDTSLENFSIPSWNKDLDIGLKGPFLCSQIFGKEMIKKKSGVIINISSDLGIISPDQRLYNRNNKKSVTYSVTKHGIIGLTKYLATYWSEYGIRSNTLCPGGVYNNQPDNFVNKIKKLIPLNRMAQKNDYKSAIQFLSSDASSYMNGSTLVIDGGRSSW
jgi:NAD(P)-dependent dehydrogenase (short-subunit alcohol dehydrogenase family)